MGDNGSRSQYLGSVNKTLDVLEAFSLDSPERSLGALSEQLAIAKPTLHRILSNLQARGYVRQDPETRRYRLGVKCWEVGVVGIGGFELRQTARPWLRHLSQGTGEQATLWVYDQGDVVCIERSEATQRVRSYTRLGAREPAHLLSVGRVLLALAAPDEAARIVSALDDPMAGYVRERLQRIPEAGYELSPGDRWPDVCALGAPIRDHTGAVIAAIGVSGPCTRFDDQHVESMAVAVTEAAAGCSREMGDVAAPTPDGAVVR